MCDIGWNILELVSLSTRKIHKLVYLYTYHFEVLGNMMLMHNYIWGKLSRLLIVPHIVFRINMKKKHSHEL